MNSLLRKIIFGQHFTQEYLCVSLGDFENGFSVFLEDEKENFIEDVTTSNSLVGYKPVVLLVESAESLLEKIKAGTDRQFRFSFYASKTKAKIAELEAELLPKYFSKPGLLFRITGGSHKLISKFHQYMNNLKEAAAKKKIGNVDLTQNLYDQVRIAYSVPRKISVAVTGSDAMVNMFPTDLNGAVDNDYYLVSLRLAGKAAQQVMLYQKLLLCTMHVSSFREVYSLGKNHMAEVRPVGEFHFTQRLSEKFKLPIPSDVISYKELSLSEFKDEGIHRLFLFRVESEILVEENKNVLAHIHVYAANWRKRNQIESTYYLR